MRRRTSVDGKTTRQIIYTVFFYASCVLMASKPKLNSSSEVSHSLHAQ